MRVARSRALVRPRYSRTIPRSRLVDVAPGLPRRSSVAPHLIALVVVFVGVALLTGCSTDGYSPRECAYACQDSGLVMEEFIRLNG
jgi:hypothetical protein